MKCIIPFESKISFSGPVKEICSITLEHEITKNDSDVLGNFFVSGSYKEHELSVNTSDFNFTIPFSVELTNRVVSDTLEFSIDNFTYELNGNDLLVKIDYSIVADDLIEEYERIEINEDPIDLIDEKTMEEINYKEIIDETKNEIVNEERKEEVLEPEKMMVSSINTENDYITYHIHIVKESETIESIAMNYKVDKEDLLTINNISKIELNDKLLVPISNE